MRQIVPERPYTFDYNTAAKEVRGEIARGYCPRLERGAEPMDAFDILFVGSPNWFGSIAPPVLSFLRAHDFGGKRIAPFCTHGGGGLGEMERRIAKACPGAVIVPGLGAGDTIDRAQVAGWLKDLGIPHEVKHGKDDLRRGDGSPLLDG